MNGKLNRITRMVVPLLGSLCLAAASFPTLAASATQISVTVNPTTGYFESTSRTIVPPNNATISPVKDVSATVVSRLPNGALAQPISNGIEITAIKQQAIVKSNIVAKPSALRRAGASCFKGAKCNAALFVGSLGLEYLFDGLDWVMGDGGKIQKKQLSPPSNLGDYDPANPVGPSWNTDMPYVYGHPCPGPLNFGDVVYWAQVDKYLAFGNCISSTGGRFCPIYDEYGGSYLSGISLSPFTCYYGASESNWNNLEYIPDSEIDSGFSAYDPQPSDWRFLVPGIDLSDPDIDVEITDAPRLTTPPITTTHYDASGNPVSVSETNIWYDFAPKNNPSKQPELEAQKTESKTEYDAGGTPVGSTTTTVINPPSSAPQLPETPIDCDLMPTLCEWMLWTKEPPPEGDEPDFDDIRQVIDLRDYQQSVTIGPATLACPEPYQIEIGFIGRSVGVSFQPFCDLADYVRPLLLMLAYFFGAYLTIRSI